MFWKNIFIDLLLIFFLVKRPFHNLLLRLYPIHYLCLFLLQLEIDILLFLMAGNHFLYLLGFGFLSLFERWWLSFGKFGLSHLCLRRCHLDLLLRIWALLGGSFWRLKGLSLGCRSRNYCGRCCTITLICRLGRGLLSCWLFWGTGFTVNSYLRGRNGR